MRSRASASQQAGVLSRLSYLLAPSPGVSEASPFLLLHSRSRRSSASPTSTVISLAGFRAGCKKNREDPAQPGSARARAGNRDASGYFRARLRVRLRVAATVSTNQGRALGPTAAGCARCRGL